MNGEDFSGKEMLELGLNYLHNPKIDGYINIGNAANTFAGVVTGYDQLNPSKTYNDPIRQLTWHETGHLLEDKLNKAQESAAFQDDREKEVPIEDRLPDRNFISGNFYNRYTGKKYFNIKPEN